MQGAIDKYLEMHPNVLLALVLAFGGAGGVVFNPFVLSSEYRADQQTAISRLSSVEYDLCLFRKEQAIANADNEVRQLNGQIWSLERAIQAASPPPRHDLELLDDARSSKEAASQRLKALHNTRCIKSNGS